MVIRGGCLCGAVAYEARLPLATFVTCYCSRCRKASGSAYGANAYVAPDAFRWTRGEALVVRYDLPEARSFATGFCSRCGSPLPHHTRSRREVVIPAGSLDDDPGTRPSITTHWASRAPWAPATPEVPIEHDERFREHQLVKTNRPLRTRWMEVPAGTVGIVVDVHRAGEAYEIEFQDHPGLVVTVTHDALDAMA